MSFGLNQLSQPEPLTSNLIHISCPDRAVLNSKSVNMWEMPDSGDEK
jgi:hypothetical protein